MFQRIVFMLLCVPFILTAEEAKPKIVKNSRFEIGPEYTRISLHVPSTSISKSAKFRGNLWGAVASYEYKEPWGIYFNINAASRANPIHGPEKRHFREQNLEGRIGYFYDLKCFKTKIIPYVGFGYSSIVQSKVGPTDLKFTASTYYVPVGFIAMYALNEKFQGGLHIKYTPQVATTVQISSLNDARWIIDQRYGLVVEFPLVYNYKWMFSCDCGIEGTISLVPYWRILQKGSGEAFTRTGLEVEIPSQRYYFYGARLMFGINF